ncbi:formate dehydrogenase subunit gamma [Mesobaculum littorinae]|uniref:Formate dehydrogenase subunit gamma n=1 Tax=Mesobaculum littorinae TaxID=2486419 RepID=A0A438AF42_9RHOB|nr:formate dehydrogenase subunit gamma [Mesobaculum littorinae]RVV97333.1 formate dehydrogenase subunit gamma [Mesobaculum littorinae]
MSASAATSGASIVATEQDLHEIGEIVARHAQLEGPLLPMLHALQDMFGHVPQAAIPVIADALNLTRAEVHGVMSFYHDFRKAKAGRHTVKICRAEACQARGANTLAATALAKLGVEWHGTTTDGAITVEPVYCLGLCANGPNAMVDGRVVAGLDETRLDALLAEART